MVEVNKKLFRWLPALLLCSGIALTADAFAQPGGTDDGDAPSAAAEAPVKKPPPGYDKFEPAPESEQISASNLVVLAYGAVFFGLFGYVVMVARGQAAMSKEIAELARRIDRAEPS